MAEKAASSAAKNGVEEIRKRHQRHENMASI
jgi:hypothetical protein